MRALIFREIDHLWLKMNRNLYIRDFTKRRKAIQQLYQEGNAMVCQHILCGDNDFWHQDKDGWIDLCRENETDGVQLTPYALRELVKKIYVSAADKSSSKRKQSI